MKATKKWADLGWRHPMWDLLRYYSSIKGPKQQPAWLNNLITTNSLLVNGSTPFAVNKEHVLLLIQYLNERKGLVDNAFKLLRTEKQSLAFCKKCKVTVGKTSTKSVDHYQSSKSLVAGVTSVAKKVVISRNLTIDPNPQRRCVWCSENGIHVTARNMDGAIPGLANPQVIWEIKEYWGKTAGGSKMSDAVYESHLMGRELRVFEDSGGFKVKHIVFVDGKSQWDDRRSDFVRFIDLLNQGFIDHLFIGKDVETEWESCLISILDGQD